MLPQVFVSVFSPEAQPLSPRRDLSGLTYTHLPSLGLTYLQLGGTYGATKEITANLLHDFVTASPFLINLDLQYLDIVFPLKTSVSDIQIPSLHSLTMRKVSSRTCNFWRLFSLFSLPKLETLAFVSYKSEFTKPLTNIRHQSHTTITVLQLVNCG